MQAQGTKLQERVMVLSPDGITIEFNKPTYLNMAAATKAYNRWAKRYEFQGYYSSSRHGRIPLNLLREHCTFKTVLK